MRNRLERQYPTPKNLKTRLIAQSSLQNFDDSIVSIFSVFFLSWKLRIASSVTTPQSWNHHDQQQSAQKKPLAISGHRKTGTGTSPSFLWQQSSIVYGLFPATFLKTREATFWFPRPTFGPSSVRPWYSEAWESPLEAPSVDPRLLEGVCPRGPILGSPSKGEKMWFLFGVKLIITYQKKVYKSGIHGDSCWSIYIGITINNDWSRFPPKIDSRGESSRCRSANMNDRDPSKIPC